MHERLQCFQTRVFSTVQIRFIRFLGCRAGFDFREVPVNEVSAAYGLLSLERRRRVADCIFLSKLLNNQVSSPFLLESINFRVPARSTRHQRLFEPDHAGTNYIRFSPIPRLMRFGNNIGSSVDLFVAALGAVRRAAADESLISVASSSNVLLL
ncbi:hypothetical protein J6590_072331 [Homalodisca vitripennis]|nr:hypothetical protein J6590_072331 [Homalodisca vitripennis]